MKKIILCCLLTSLFIGCSSQNSNSLNEITTTTNTSIETTTELKSLDDIKEPEIAIVPRKNLAENINTKDLRKLIVDYYKINNAEIRYDSSKSNNTETYYDFFEYYNGIIVEPIKIRVHVYNDNESDITIQGTPITDINDTKANCSKIDFMKPTHTYTIEEAQKSIDETTLYFGDCYYYDNEKIYYCYIFETDSNIIIVDTNNLENCWYKEVR